MLIISFENLLPHYTYIFNQIKVHFYFIVTLGFFGLPAQPSE